MMPLIVKNHKGEKLMRDLTSEDFESSMQETVVVDFWAPWCGPCNAMKPVFEEASKEVDVEFAKFNIEDGSKVAEKYNIQSIPAVLILKNGKEIARQTGLQSKDSLIEFVNENI